MFFASSPPPTATSALRALAHPTRLRLLGLLRIDGDATATECSAKVGESPSSCSYHLRTLARHGFVEQVSSADGRETRWHARVASIDFAAGAEEDEDFQRASSLARGALLEVGDDAVRSYLAAERTFSPSWREAAAFLQTAIVATPEELDDLAERVAALLEPYQAGARKRKPRGARLVHVSLRGVPDA
jgi:DNA-binding transcriptional ArsR family regulator